MERSEVNKRKSVSIESLARGLSKIGLSENATLAVSVLLTYGRCTVSQVALYSKLPRTTVYGVLREARESGVVEEEKVKGLIYFKSVSEHDMKAKLHELRDESEKLLPYFKSAEKVQIGESGASQVIEYRGKSGVSHAYDPLITLSKGERIYSIEGVDSIETKMNLLTKSKLISWHNTIKKKGIIIDALTNKKAIETFLDYGTDELLSHHGRAVTVSVLEGAFFSAGADLILYRDHVLEIDHKRNVAINIKSESLSQILKQLFHIARGKAELVDLNEEIVKELKRRGVVLQERA